MIEGKKLHFFNIFVIKLLIVLTKVITKVLRKCHLCYLILKSVHLCELIRHLSVIYISIPYLAIYYGELQSMLKQGFLIAVPFIMLMTS